MSSRLLFISFSLEADVPLIELQHRRSLKTHIVSIRTGQSEHSISILTVHDSILVLSSPPAIAPHPHLIISCHRMLCPLPFHSIVLSTVVKSAPIAALLYLPRTPLTSFALILYVPAASILDPQYFISPVISYLAFIPNSIGSPTSVRPPIVRPCAQVVDVLCGELAPNERILK